MVTDVWTGGLEIINVYSVKIRNMVGKNKKLLGYCTGAATPAGLGPGRLAGAAAPPEARPEKLAGKVAPAGPGAVD